MNSRMFMLVSIIEVIAIVYVLCRIFRLMKKLFAVIRRRGEGSSIKTYGNPVAGVYTVLASKDFYDGIYQGIEILAEAQDGTRHVFWTLHDPITFIDVPPMFCFFDTLVCGDRISVSMDEDRNIRATLFYG